MAVWTMEDTIKKLSAEKKLLELQVESLEKEINMDDKILTIRKVKKVRDQIMLSNKYSNYLFAMNEFTKINLG